jgi:tripartite-type tricarboxylate transporter receptor subunit TctC
MNSKRAGAIRSLAADPTAQLALTRAQRNWMATDGAGDTKDKRQSEITCRGKPLRSLRTSTPDAHGGAEPKTSTRVAASRLLSPRGGNAGRRRQATTASAQVYPSRPITVIVPWPAGGPSDTIARIMAECMRVSLGQPVIIENVTGASGSIGAGRVARAAGDGYTLGLGSWPTHVVNGAVFALQYNVLNDFEPISLLATQQQLIIAKKAMPANDLKELIVWLKANPNKASQGTSGAGSAAHVVGAYFQQETGTRFQFVPYRGVNLAMQDLLAGQIDMMIDLAANSLPQVRAGNVKAYGVTAKSRLAAAPDVPTVDEAGLPGFYTSVWHAFFVPKGTPKTVIGDLNVAVVDALADPAVRQRFADLGMELPPREQQTPEAFGVFHKAEIAKWWPIIKTANIKAE